MFTKERREVFADAMTRLTRATLNCLNDKRENLISQKTALEDEYNRTNASNADRFKLRFKIEGIENSISAIEDKINHYNCNSDFYEKKSNDEIDASMKLTEDKLDRMVDNGSISMPDIAEGAISAAQRIVDLDKSQVAALADQLGIEPLYKVEEQVEDDYNMILSITLDTIMKKFEI